LLAASIVSEEVPELRIAAILGIGEVRDPDALVAILSAAEDDDPGVRRAAAEALTVIPGRRAEVRLESLRDNDPDAKVRRRARQSLRKRAKAARG
jgi:HEAT repeat protein